MKRASLKILAFASLATGLFAFASIREGGIQGRVTPAEGVKEVIAISGTDTLFSELNEGIFLFNQVKKGEYMLLIKANPPYKDATVSNVAVIDSATTDVGEIKLEQ